MVRYGQIYQTEAGRSMTEMLGVLAIIGVLSIGGIAGYNVAIDNYNVNEIVGGVIERSIELSRQKIAGITITKKSLDITYGANNKINGMYGVEVIPDTGVKGEFGLKVSEIRQNVCQRIINLEWRTPVRIIGETAGVTCDKEINNLTFAFQDNLGEKPETVSSSAAP